MSLPINPYNNTSVYSSRLADSQTAAAKLAQSGQTEKETSKTVDSLQLSPEYLTYLANNQDQFSTTTTYDANTSEDTDPLTTDEKKSILTDLQSKLSSLLSSSTVSDEEDSNPLSELLSELEEKLSDFDASTATEEEIAELFDDVAQTVAEARPPRPEGPPPEGGDANGQPPASEGGIPPFVLDLLNEISAGNSGDAADLTGSSELASQDDSAGSV